MLHFTSVSMSGVPAGPQLCGGPPPGHRRASSRQISWSRAPPTGPEGQLHHIIIHSKPVMKSPSSSAAIRKNGSLKKGEERERERENEEERENKRRNQKWINSATIFRMIVERVLRPLSGFSHGFFFFFRDRN